MAIQLGQIIGQVGSGIYKLVKGKDVDFTQATLDADLTTTTGTELILNGDFSSVSGGLPTNWVETTNNSAYQGLFVNNGQLVIFSNVGVNGFAVQTLQTPTVIGKTYKFKIDIISSVGANNTPILNKIRIGTIPASNLGAVGTLSNANITLDADLSTGNNQVFYFTANAVHTQLAIGGRDDINTLTVDNVSMEEYKHDEDVILISDNDETASNSSTTSKSKLFVLFNYIKNKLINAKLTFPGFGTTAGTVLEGDTTIITEAQIDKVDYLNVTASTDLDTMRSDVTANNAKTGITSTQANAITNNASEISNMKADKADLQSPTFTGTIAIPNISNVETAITTNTTNIASNTTAISNKPSTAVTDIDFVPSSASLIHLDTTTNPSGTEKRLSINAGTNLSLASTSATSFTINAPAFGTSAGTILEGNTTLVNSLVAGTGISISSSSGNVTVTSTATPAGGNGQIQYNNNGAFGATTLGFSPASGSDPAVLSFSGTLKIHNVQAEDDDRPIISTDNNETTISGRVNIATREIKIQSTQQNAGTGRGDVVYYGNVADSGNLTAGKVYYYAPNGNWTLVNAGAVGTSSGILGVALGASPTTNGLLVNGSVFLDHHAGTGDGQTLYLSTTDGELTSTKPTGTNQVRIVGTVIKHHTNRCEVLFDPTNFDGQATNPASSSFADIYSISFDGTGDYSVADLPSNWGKNEGTLSFWVNLNITDDASKYLMAFTTGDGNFNDFIIIHYFKVSSSRYALLARQRRTVSGTTTEHTTVAQQDSQYHGRPLQRTSGAFTNIQQNYNSIRTSDTWTHIAVTWDADATYDYNNVNYDGNQTIYVNGAKVGDGTGTLPSHNNIGTNNEMDYDRDNDLNKVYLATLSPSHGMANMLMDDLAIWNTALNDNNITAIYNSGTPINLLTDAGNYNQSNNLAGYWKFENNNDDSKSTNDLVRYGDAEFVSGTGKTPST